MAPRKKNGGGDGGSAAMSDYEKARHERIQANKARLAELGLGSQFPPQQKNKAPSQMHSHSAEVRRSKRLKGSTKSCSFDEEKDEPSDEETNSEEEGDYVPSPAENTVAESDGSEEYMSEEEDLAASSSKQKGHTKKAVEYNEDDVELQQAIALSLQEDLKHSSSKHKKKSARKGTFHLSASEIDALYYAIVGDRIGLSMRELQQAANTHNFTWSKSELEDMISTFDADGDKMLSLDEFRRMSVRCHILDESDQV